LGRLVTLRSLDPIRVRVGVRVRVEVTVRITLRSLDLHMMRR